MDPTSQPRLLEPFPLDFWMMIAMWAICGMGVLAWIILLWSQHRRGKDL